MPEPTNPPIKGAASNNLTELLGKIEKAVEEIKKAVEEIRVEMD